MKLFDILKLDLDNELDRAAWKGFLLGILITVLTLCPFILLTISFMIHEIHVHHIHMPLHHMPLIMP